MPRNWGKNVTLLASMSLRGMAPCLAVAKGRPRGRSSRPIWSGFWRPRFGRGNLTAHKGERVRKLIEGEGCELLYLPPYSPDFNPIEEAFAKLKALLRKAGARSREALIEAMGRALEALTAKDACGFFEHRGYRATAQLL